MVINIDNKIYFIFFYIEGGECVLYDGGIGICKAFEECKTALDELNRGVIRYNQIQATRCSFRVC